MVLALGLVILGLEMSAVAAGPTVNITINDIEIAVPKGELVVEAVKRVGLEIPIFCYHPRMKPVGMCRMCLVEVGTKQPDGSIRKMPKPQAACTLPASEGLVIYTDSEMVRKDRRNVLEFLLINHPLDCPVCDRGGECPLQNNTLFYGPSTSRYVEVKRHAPKAYPLSKYVSFDLERCIQCARCVRFTEEISGDADLAFRFRGASTQPSTFELKEFTSKFSGNVIEICPVGALTSRVYRFRARPWDLETKPAICTQCSNGCNVWFDYRAGKFVRINARTNEAINEEWTCDKGKFGHDWYNSEKRLTQPLQRSGSTLAPSDWGTVLGQVVDSLGAGQSAVIAGTGVSNETLYALKKLIGDNVAYPHGAGVAPTMPTSIAGLEQAKSILIFGSSLADDAPIVFLRVRKAAVRNGVKVVVVADKATDADSFADVVIRYKSGSEAAVAAALAKGTTGVVADADLAAAKAALGDAPTILTTTSTSQQAVSALRDIAGSTVNVLALGANEFGANRILGTTLSVEKTLADCAAGKVKTLWLIGIDLFGLGLDASLVQSALEEVPFVIYQGTLETPTMAYASVVLPMAAPAEQDGTFTNVEGRVQRLKQAVTAPGSTKPGWQIVAEIGLRQGSGTPAFNASELFAELAATTEAFSALAYETLTDEGTLIN